VHKEHTKHYIRSVLCRLGCNMVDPPLHVVLPWWLLIRALCLLVRAPIGKVSHLLAIVAWSYVAGPLTSAVLLLWILDGRLWNLVPSMLLLLLWLLRWLSNRPLTLVDIPLWLRLILIGVPLRLLVLVVISLLLALASLTVHWPRWVLVEVRASIAA